MNPRPPSPAGRRRINWQNALTVVSAAILIGAEVFGAAFAGGWAVASSLASNGLDLGSYGTHIMQGIFFLCGIAVMIAFLRSAQRVEPFTSSD
jgi:hypothetical protein